MQIEYSLNAHDYQQIQKYQKSEMRKIVRTKSIILNIFATLIFFSLFIVALLFLEKLQLDKIYYLLYLIIIPTISVLFLKWLAVRKFYQYVADAIPPNNRHTISITDHGLIISSGLSNETISWHHIKEIVDHPEHIMFVLPILNVFAVPKRSFPGNNEMEAFINEARNKMNNSINS